MDELSHNPHFKALIVTGSGNKSFVAGADIGEFVSITPEQGRAISIRGNRVFSAIESFNRPVIMAINGYALGGGLELALAGHIRIASENAVLGLPEVGLGIFPGYGGTQRLPALVGKAKAMELIFTADRITAAEALALGLVNYVVNAEKLMEKCMEMVVKIKKNSTKSIALSIEAINAWTHFNGIETEINQFEKCFQGDMSDFKTRVNHFLVGKKSF